MFITRVLTLSLLLILLFRVTAIAQTIDKAQETGARGVTITAAANGERVRLTAPSSVVQMRLEVVSDAGQTLADLSTKGNVLDWALFDGAGQLIGDGAYLCVVTVKSLSGRLSQRIGSISIEGERVRLRQLESGQLTAAQQQAVGPVEGNAALTLLKEGETAAATIVAHDGTNGQVTSTTGALTFRTGDFFSGKERERMRLSEEGNLGIGTEQPEARLDVNGMIRAREGFQFADGSVLNLAPQGTGLRVTLPGGETARVNFAPNAVTGTANRIPKFAADGTSLQDSAIYQDPNNGNIGIGTTTPAHPFVVRRNGGSLGVHTVGELFVDRDNNSRSASLTVGTAGVLKWIFGMPSGGDGFQVYDLTHNVSRFFVDPNNGNIGIGTTTPTSKLTAFTSNFSYGFSQTNGTTTVSSYIDPTGGWLGTRSNHPLYFFTNGGLQQMTLATNGNFGIGTAAPNTRLTLSGGTPWTANGWTATMNMQNASAFGWEPNASGQRFGIGQTSGGLYFFRTDAAFGTTTNSANYDMVINDAGNLQVTGNVIQSRDKGGSVKAMMYVNGDSTMIRCYNGITGSSSGNCGFTVGRLTGAGNYQIDFGFQVSDRFFSVTVENYNGVGEQPDAGVSIGFVTTNGMAINTYQIGTGPSDRPFMLIVY